MAASQIYMLIFLSFYFGVLIGLRSYMLCRQTNVDPIKKFGLNQTIVKQRDLFKQVFFYWSLLLLVTLIFRNQRLILNVKLTGLPISNTPLLIAIFRTSDIFD